MKTTLFYFSATGNCLTTARKLARYFDDCEVISVSALKKERKIFVDADTVGFVFPVRQPPPVVRVRERLKVIVSPFPLPKAMTLRIKLIEFFREIVKSV